MPSIVKQAFSPYADKDLFEMVNDVARYPEFIRGCHATEVLYSSETQLQARLWLRQGPLKHSITTANELQRFHRMRLTLIDGPFKSFSGEWQFNASDTNLQTEIRFALNYEFNNRLLALSAGAVFYQLANQLVDTFVQRAQQLYGKN